MRLLRALVVGFLALLVLLIGGIAAFWWLGGAEAQRWAARHVLQAALDREVQVDGTLEVELGAEPGLRVTDLRIDNPSWAETPALLRVARAEVQIALRPLLHRVLLFPRVALDGVTVDLETAADGRHSWASGDAPPGRQLAAFPLFESLAVSDATITYLDRRDGQRAEVRIESLVGNRDDAAGRMRLEANGTINDRAFQIHGASGSLEAALAATAPYPLELEFQLPGIDAKLDGTVADVTRAEGLDLRLSVQADSLRAAAEAWDLSVPVDARIEADARLTGDLVALSLADLVAELTNSAGDHLKLAGSLGDVWAGSGLEATLTLKLGPEGELARMVPEDWRVLDGFDATANVTGSVAAPRLDDIAVAIAGPGKSTGKLAGKIGLAAAERGVALDSFDLTSSLAVPEPSAFAHLLGFDPSVLGPLHAEAGLTLANRMIDVTALSIDATDFGALHIEADGAVGSLAADRTLRLEPQLYLTAAMARSAPLLAMVDGRAPDLGPIDASGQLLGDRGGYRLEGIELDLGAADQLALHATGTIGPLVAADPGTAEVDLNVRFGWPSSRVLEPLLGRELPDLGKADGAFQLAGTVASLSVAGASLKTRRDDGIAVAATGDIASVRTGTPPQIEGAAFDLDARAPSTAVVARLFGYEAPDLGPVRAQAKLGARESSIGLSAIDLVAGPGDPPLLRVTGAVGDVLAFKHLALKGDLEIPTSTLLALADIHGKSEVGKLHGSARLSDAAGPVGIEHFEAEVRETDLLSFTVEGLIDDLAALDRVKFETSLEVPDIAKLAEVFDADASGLERFQFDGKLSGSDRRFDADGEAILGETHVTGVLAGDFTGARPSFEGRLHSPHVRLVDLGLVPAAAGAESATGDATEAGGQAATSGLFGTEPLPVERLEDFDLDLDVQLDDIEGIELAIDQAKAQVTIVDGELNLAPLRFAFVGGRAEMNARVAARGPEPRWHVRAESDDVKLEDLWTQLNTEVPLSGNLDLVLDLQATGTSPRDLAESLAGEFSVAVQRGQIRSGWFGLTTMSPLRWLVAESTRRGYTEIDCFVARFQAEHGVAEAVALLLDTPNVVATGKGSIDFARETIDLRIDPRAKRRRLADLTTPFAIKGSLAHPSVGTGGAGVAMRMAEEVALSPLTFLGLLLPFVGDGGKDPENPCLTLSLSEVKE